MRLGLLITAGILAAAFILGGYLLGKDAATTEAEANQVRAEARIAASARSEMVAYDRARKRGEKKGEAEGHHAGLEAGAKGGGKAGDASVAAEQAEAASAAEAAAPPPVEVCGTYDECLQPGAQLNINCPAGQVVVNGSCQAPPPGYLPGDLLPGDSE